MIHLQVSLTNPATARLWYYDDWMNEAHKDMAICSCNDGLRPVIIKVERTDEVSKVADWL